MSAQRGSSKSDQANSDRRSHARFMPPAPLYVMFGERDGGVVVDMSESGVLLATSLSLVADYLPRIYIPLNKLGDGIEVSARTIWREETTQRAAFELVGLSERDLQKLRALLWRIAESQPKLATPEAARLLASVSAPPTHQIPGLVAANAFPEFDRQRALREALAKDPTQFLPRPLKSPNPNSDPAFPPLASEYFAANHMQFPGLDETTSSSANHDTNSEADARANADRSTRPSVPLESTFPYPPAAAFPSERIVVSSQPRVAAAKAAESRPSLESTFPYPPRTHFDGAIAEKTVAPPPSVAVPPAPKKSRKFKFSRWPSVVSSRSIPLPVPDLSTSVAPLPNAAAAPKHLEITTPVEESIAPLLVAPETQQVNAAPPLAEQSDALASRIPVLEPEPILQEASAQDSVPALAPRFVVQPVPTPEPFLAAPPILDAPSTGLSETAVENIAGAQEIAPEKSDTPLSEETLPVRSELSAVQPLPHETAGPIEQVLAAAVESPVEALARLEAAPIEAAASNETIAVAQQRLAPEEAVTEAAVIGRIAPVELNNPGEIAEPGETVPVERAALSEVLAPVEPTALAEEQLARPEIVSEPAPIEAAVSEPTLTEAASITELSVATAAEPPATAAQLSPAEEIALELPVEEIESTENSHPVPLHVLSDVEPSAAVEASPAADLPSEALLTPDTPIVDATIASPEESRENAAIVPEEAFLLEDLPLAQTQQVSPAHPVLGPLDILAEALPRATPEELSSPEPITVPDEEDDAAFPTILDLYTEPASPRAINPAKIESAHPPLIEEFAVSAPIVAAALPNKEPELPPTAAAAPPIQPPVAELELPPAITAPAAAAAAASAPITEPSAQAEPEVSPAIPAFAPTLPKEEPRVKPAAKPPKRPAKGEKRSTNLDSPDDEEPVFPPPPPEHRVSVEMKWIAAVALLTLIAVGGLTWYLNRDSYERSDYSAAPRSSSAKPTPTATVTPSQPTPSPETTPAASAASAAPVVAANSTPDPDAATLAPPKSAAATALTIKPPATVPTTYPDMGLSGTVTPAPQNVSLDQSHRTIQRALMITIPPPSSPALHLKIPEDRPIHSGSVLIQTQRSIYVVPSRIAVDGKNQAQILLGELQSPTMPRFPAEGVVSVRATVDEQGRVVEIEPISGSTSLFPAVEAALKAWQYAPTVFQGQMIATQVDITLHFGSVR